MTSKINAKTTNSGHKMPAKVTCYKCKNIVDKKQTALCSICKNRYELECDGYPEKTYRLLDQAAKKKWRCKMCIKNKKDINSDMHNITTRKKPNLTKQCTSPSPEKPPEKLQCFESSQLSDQNTSYVLDSHILTDYNITDESFTTPSKLSKSVDGTVTDITSISDMKITVSQLTCTLESTQNELENLILENNDLHRQIHKLTSENKILKSLCHSPTAIEGSPGIFNKNKKKRNSLLIPSVSSVPSSPTIKSHVNSHTNTVILCLQRKISDLQKQLKEAEKEITGLTEKNKESDTKNVP
ncbi:unnamed protein product [Parnassius mnemosyne]|uniref:PHD-type domain-containing protein n=1 Tax=Parnassius mnemosyne TaxID=213953 RepID=A0AAV1KX85_9NEOP